MGSLFGPRPEKKIFDVIDRRDLAALQRLLDRSPNAAKARHPAHGGTPLHLVAHSGWESAARLLLDKGANPNIADDAYGALPLHVALTKRNVSVAMQLIEAGSNRHHRHKNQYTPLMVALEQRHVECVEALLRSGINPMEGTQGMPLMAWACVRWELMTDEAHQDACAAMTLRLIEYGCEVDTVAVEGWTALMFAGALGQYGVVRLLLEHGADADRVNDKGERAVDLAKRALQKAKESGEGRGLAQLERTVQLLQ
jgi:ankyrin repeat protein